jgi:hypothetical protein
MSLHNRSTRHERRKARMRLSPNPQRVLGRTLAQIAVEDRLVLRQVLIDRAALSGAIELARDGVC